MPKKKNPKPKIGSSKSAKVQGFKPSKKLAKQYPKVQKKYQDSISDLRQSLIDRGFGDRIREHIEDFPGGELIDEVAVIASSAGSIEQAAEDLGISAEDLETALLRGYFTTAETRYMRENVRVLLDSEPEYITEDFERDASIVRWSTDQMDYDDNERIYRYAVAQGAIDFNDAVEGRSLLRDLTVAQLEKLLDRWFESFGTEEQFDLDEMYQRYLADGGDIMHVSESEFWAWYREIVYPG